MAEPCVLPDFIIGGAPRSGTTFLCHALGAHPGIFVAQPFIPEPKVFMGAVRERAAYLERYRQLFAAAAPGQKRGEKTSYYLESEQACRLIRELCPDVRLIFMLREPVARAYSNYLWTKKNGLETLSFEEAIGAEGRRPDPMPPDRAYARPFDYLARADYAKFLERYYRAFDRDRIGIFLYEDILARPQPLLAQIQRFIGVEPLPFDRIDPGVVNSAKDQGPSLDAAVEARLRALLRPLVDRLQALTGLDLSAWGY